MISDKELSRMINWEDGLECNEGTVNDTNQYAVGLVRVTVDTGPGGLIVYDVFSETGTPRNDNMDQVFSIRNKATPYDAALAIVDAIGLVEPQYSAMIGLLNTLNEQGLIKE